MSPTRNRKLWPLLAASLLLACSPREPAGGGSLKLWQLLDRAQLRGDAATPLRASPGAPEIWRPLLRDTFEPGAPLRWKPAPNFFRPPEADLAGTALWARETQRLAQAAAPVRDRDGRPALRVAVRSDLPWLGYILPLPIRGGRRYRISASVRTQGLTATGAKRTAAVGFLELSRGLPPAEAYRAEEVKPFILERQADDGAAGTTPWQQESFTFTAQEGTETLVLFLCVYEGSGELLGGEVLYRDVTLEELVQPDLAAAVDRGYPSPRTGKISARSDLFRACDWGKPTKVGHYLEGIVSPGSSDLEFLIETRGFANLRFWYGPLKEYSGLRAGSLTFEVLLDDRIAFSRRVDFAAGGGKSGWRSAEVRLEGSPSRLTLRTRAEGTPEPVAGFWGEPTLLPGPSRSPRRILMVLVDSLRSDLVGAYAAGGRTPVFDALARDGTRYTRFFSAGNTTRYAQFSLFTGRYPARSGMRLSSVYDLLTEEYQRHFYQRLDTFPALLRDAGFLTFAVMDSYFFLPLPAGLHVGFDEVFHYGSGDEPFRSSVDLLLDFLAKNRDRDTFALLHLDPDHLQRLPPSASADELLAAYRDEMAAIEREVGRVFAFLRQEGLYDGTDIVLLSDHGENLDPRFLGHGEFLSDDQINVPLILKQARATAPGGVHAGDVSMIDLAPWVLRRAGIPAPQGFSGLASALGPEVGPERVLFSEGINSERLALISGEDRYTLAADGSERTHVAPGAAQERIDRLHFLAGQYYADTHPGLYLHLDASRDGYRVSLRGVGEPIVLGRQAQDAVSASGGTCRLEIAAGGQRRLIHAPLRQLRFPVVIDVSAGGGRVAAALAPDFLPTGRLPLTIPDAAALAALASGSFPVGERGPNPLLVWSVAGTGFETGKTDAGNLDQNLKNLLRKWGYLK